MNAHPTRRLTGVLTGLPLLLPAAASTQVAPVPFGKLSRLLRLGLVAVTVAIVMAAVACGDGKSTTAPTPTIVNVAGLWTATLRMTSVSGGECVGPSWGYLVGQQDTYTLQVTQNGSALTARATSTSEGVSTDFSGTAGTNTISLNATVSPDAWIYGATCTSGEKRDVQMTAGTINGTINGNTGSGTYVETYNVFLAGTRNAVGVLTFTGSFTMTR
jgi:hypothetical protein